MATLEQAWNRQNVALERIADALEDLTVRDLSMAEKAERAVRLEGAFPDGPFPDDDLAEKERVVAAPIQWLGDDDKEESKR